MPEIIDAEAREQLERLLGGMREPVTLVYFTQEHPCAAGDRCPLRCQFGLAFEAAR